MKAMRFDRYGDPRDVLGFQDVEVPTPGAGEVLVRVRAAGLNPADWHLTTGVPHVARAQMGMRAPKVRGLGADLAGRVEAVGADVTRFSVGDEVYGCLDTSDPGRADGGNGSVAELALAPDDAIRHRPAGLSAVEAAAVPLAATTALRGLLAVADVRTGQDVLVNGASGGVGTFAVQLARVLGANVTGVCSTRNVELVRSLGAEVIDYTRTDPTSSGRRFDLVFDNVGNHAAGAWRRVLRPGGTYLASFGHKEHRHLGPLGAMARAMALGVVVSQRMTFLPTRWDVTELERLSELLESGQVEPVIDRTFPLAAAADALTYLGEGHARGKVVVIVQEG